MYDMYDQDTRRAGPRLVTQTTADDQQGKDRKTKEEPLPLPGWLLKLYFIFPVILYIPDAIFNYFVYSDGAAVPQTDNVFLLVSQIALWGFLSVGVVGMAYLLSMLAPWHWMQGHKIQAFFCGFGVIIATSITIWNSLAYRSVSFKPFATDQWVYQIWPDLSRQQISITMILAAIAPPFWGLFWAIVQPIQTKRNLFHLAESHAERMMRLQQEAELKSLRAEANAQIRAAQLKGMAQTAAAAREQMGVVAAQLRSKKAGGKSDEASPAVDTVAVIETGSTSDLGGRLSDPERGPRTPDNTQGHLSPHQRGGMSSTVAAPMNLPAAAPRRPGGARQAQAKQRLAPVSVARAPRPGATPDVTDDPTAEAVEAERDHTPAIRRAARRG